MKYKTRRGAPKAVRYLDRSLSSKPYFLSWIAIQGAVYGDVDEIMCEEQVTKKEAVHATWNAFFDAVIGNEISPQYENWWSMVDAVADPEIPEFVLHFTVATDMHVQGMTEKQAVKAFIKFLEEDPKNGAYEDGYRMLPDMTVVREE